ncbi:Translocation and assembly module subunit TamA [Rhodocyclaceae bacterium]|nr:Translocation and assembly module subunit TamA [Rhodocyclaceae bacterium]
MANVGNRDYSLPARLLGFALAIAMLSSGRADAQQAWDASNTPTITLSAPESVRDLLETHFALPGATLPDETARATFMRRAQREIGELLATEGYFTPTVTLQPAGPDGVMVVEVVPGPRTLVTQLNIVFKGDLAADNAERRARVERLRAAWPLGVGAPFRSSVWEEAKAALLSSVTREDYAAAQIAMSQVDVDPAAASAQLMVVVDSGPAFRFGDLAVSGLERYERNLVTRLAPFRTGDPYRRDLLLNFQTRLQNLPQFSSVIVNIEPDAATHEAAPVRVVVVEAKSRRVAIGVGYSSNNGARSEINYRSYNFLKRALNLNSRLRLEQNRQTLSAGLDTLPDDDGYRLSWLTSVQATHIQGLKTLDRNFGVTRSRTLGQIETQIGINWQDEKRRPAGGIQQTNQALVLDWQWRRRAVDDPLYPRRGNVTEIRVGGASRELLSDQNFLRSYARHQIWWPVGTRDIFSLRGEAGYTAALSRAGIPQEYLFRAGGAQSVRGYPYQSLGVHEGAAVVGGRALATASAEYTHWFSRDWGAALFIDAGDAADILPDLRLATGYGSGARWRSPVGPLAVDVAWGPEAHALRLHFSIAVAF